MSQAEELLNSLPEYDVVVTSIDPATEPHIVINADRTISVPEALKHIAVQGEHNIETVTFDCPRYWDGHDLSTMIMRIVYQRPDGYREPHPVENLRVDETDANMVHFDWTISGNVTLKKGNIIFMVCAKLSNVEGVREQEWHSRLNRDLIVDEGMECSGEEIVEQNPDILESILVRLSAVEEYGDKNPTSGTVGAFSLLNHYGEIPAWNTTAKTLTIPAQSRILTTTNKYTHGMTDSSPITIDLPYERGMVCYDTESGVFTAYSHDPEKDSIPKTSLLIATYAQYGAVVNMASAYTIDGVLYGVKADIQNGAITTDKIADNAVTFKKRTVTGSYGLLWSKYGVLEFDTISQKLKIPPYAELSLGGVNYSNTVDYGGLTIDLSGIAYGAVMYNTATSQYIVWAYDNYAVRPETLIPIAAYTEYGKTVFAPGPYKIDGYLYGIDTTSTIEDGSITKEKLAPKLLQNHLSRCPRYTFTDMSAIGIRDWSDICIINGNLWMFSPSTGEEHTSSDGIIRIVNKETLETVKTITHNFGHVNTCDYCKETDCLIVGNLPGNGAYPAALYIFYNVSEWVNVDSLNFATVDKTIVDMRGAFPTATAAACSWGESNFAYNNIAYVSFGYDKQFTKIVLGMGTNQLTNGTYTAVDADKFNGTYNILQTSDFAPMGSGDEVIQGATFYNGQMLTANGDEYTARASLWQFDINGNIQRELWEFPIYNADGHKNSQYKTYTEGIAVDDETGYIYQGIYAGQLYAIRFYLIKYKLGDRPEDSPSGLPEVTVNDAGKFLRVSSSGAWAAEAIPNAEGVSF